MIGKDGDDGFVFFRRHPWKSGGHGITYIGKKLCYAK